MAQTLKQIKKERRKPRRWLWDGMIREGSVNVLVAAQSSGKSQLALGLVKEMLKARTGQAFLERGVRPCRILYLSTEMNRDIISERLAELGVDGRMAGARNRFFIYDKELNMEVVEREVAECDPDLVVIDIMGGLFVGEGLEINSYDAFNTIVPKLRRTGKTFLLIHHLNKQGKAMGSVGSLSAMDTRMEMTVTEHGGEEGDYVIYQHLHVYGKEVAGYVRDQLNALEPMLREGCAGQLPEIYEGDFPTESKGCFGQAWSVGEMLRVFEAIEK